MRVKGEIGADITQKEEIYFGEDKPAKEGELKWYDKINYDQIDIPFCVRPKGKGGRVDFFTFGNLQDKALEIKEAGRFRFKHSGDVHRNAHYIGMYILYHMYINNKKPNVKEKLFEATEMTLAEASEKEFLREQFQRVFDQYVNGMLSPEKLKDSVNKLASIITDKDTKDWFLEDVDKTLGDDRSYLKVKNKLRMREARSAGLSLVREGID